MNKLPSPSFHIREVQRIESESAAHFQTIYYSYLLDYPTAS